MFLKGTRCFSAKCPIEKDGGTPPGVHGSKSGFRQSAYAKQLRAKQKTKRLYGLSESQFKNYFLKAKKEKGITGEILLRFLEMRFDNCLYRLGLSPSRVAARQLIGHGHVLLNNQKVTIPSFMVSPGDQIGLSEKALKMEKNKYALAKKEKPPSWLERKGFLGRVVDLPKRDQMPTEIDESLIVEYYSR